jgi:fumarylacetoacetase
MKNNGDNAVILQNDPALKSFIDVSPASHFPIQNLPFGIFRPKTGGNARIGVAIGEMILDLSIIESAGLFSNSSFLNHSSIFNQVTLNPFMALGRPAWREARSIISKLLRIDEPTLRDNQELRSRALINSKDVEMLLPVKVGGFTDFYSSKEHASNIGTMFRGKENPLMPNWLHLPVAYDARASTIVVSGTNFRRPMGQIKPPEVDCPVYDECQQLDTEIEVAFIIGTPNNFGEPISVEKAPEHIFGMVLLSDWSARDIQKWEYVPLGPFLGKNFCTSISPWVVTLDALEPFRVQGVAQEPEPLPYLRSSRDWNYDIALEFMIQTEKMQQPHPISSANYRGIYWDFCQQLAHHTMGGCNMATGDIFASGTISGQTSDSYGSIIELTWGGTKPIKLPNGEERKFLCDGDKIIINGWCQADGYRVGFGSLTGKVLPSIKKLRQTE